MLTTREQVFCAAYQETGNAEAAYRRAFRSDRLKSATIAARAAALLARESIADRLTELGQTDRTPAPTAMPGEGSTCPAGSADDPSEEWRGTEIAPAAIDRAWVLQRLVLNVERALLLTPAKERASSGAGLAYNGAVANRALELIGKELGMFVDRREVRAGPLADKTDDELNALIRHLLEEAGLAHGSPSRRFAEPDDEEVDSAAP